MPELPEVETLKRELEQTIVGKKIADVVIHHSVVIRGIPPDAFRRGLRGQTIESVARRAKVLILALSGGAFLVVHLKMTGQFVYPGDGKNSRVTFQFTDKTSLDFNDRRLFAELRLIDDWREFPFIKGLGPEPFDMTEGQFQKILAAKTTKIKPLLMDQGIISGIGNLYAAEILFRARVHPARPAKELSAEESRRIFEEMKATLREAIEHKGSSVDQYVRLSGEPGDYVKKHKVYGRDGKPCSVCASPIKRISLAGRGTYL